MNLLELRYRKGISQNDVAKALDITANRYARYERGEREADYETLCALADFFDVSIDELIGRTTAPQLFDNARVERPEILELYDELTPAQQQNLLNYARGMAVSNTLENQSTTKQKKRA